ncbi:MAG TPA: hypothetical protein VFO35_21040 [Steroidobacteraceae bacterium]|nr:hypothetical protein [Steroidobacteraceae bacterium]
MGRILFTAVVILASAAFGAVLLCVLALRILLSTLVALSGVRRRMTHGVQVLDW